MDLHSLLALPLPHCLPFREMAAHPAIVQRLNWIQGPGFKLNTLGFSIVSEQGCGGQSLHANGTPLWGAVNAFQLHDGRFGAGSVNVAWQLHDVDCIEDGGFCVIPGSHKASFGCPTEDPGHPRAWADLGLTQPKVKAGDAVIFMGAATTHGERAGGRNATQRKHASQPFDCFAHS
jgi:ectoine hydroxylase-related dioxygenase (phytanoyl-CoA dioxygenase family)